MAISLAGASFLGTSRAIAAQVSVDGQSESRHGHGPPRTSEALGGAITLEEALLENRQIKAESPNTQMKDETASFPATNSYGLLGYDQKQLLISKESNKQQQEQKGEKDFEKLIELGALLGLFHHTEFAYGAPSSDTSGSLDSRTHLLGDALGLRKTWAEKGLFIDFWSTTFYQGVSGAEGVAIAEMARGLKK